MNGSIGYGTSFLLTGYIDTGIVSAGDWVCLNADISADIPEELQDNRLNNEDILHNCFQVQESLPAVQYVNL
ncbi:MAG: hypothetical protein GXP45_03610 [bacterium]|nr:hypothetical protein [bacterium]